MYKIVLWIILVQYI